MARLTFRSPPYLLFFGWDDEWEPITGLFYKDIETLRLLGRVSVPFKEDRDAKPDDRR